ncbi:MAG: type VI secretion system protein TssA [Gammaproteobacteria bacterium]
MIDVQALLVEIAPDAPCGENLEYDPAFTELEQAVRGTPEQQLGDGSTPAEGPNWRDIQRQAVALLARTKDLRVATHLAQALLFTDGLVGLREGLALVRGLLERYWAPLHPQLDEEDDYDPTQRMNIVMSLCDPAIALRGVRQAPLTSSRTLGRYNLRDIHIASGRAPALPGSDQAAPQMATIEAAFQDSDLGNLQALADAMRASQDDISGIEAFVTDQVGAERAPNMSALAKLLKEIHQVVSGQLTRRGAGSQAAEPATSATPQAVGAAFAAAPASGEIATREDVARLLDKACEYFERHEPSSPVPLLLKRARRLISKSFMDIMRDLAPAGVGQAEVISGSDKKE